MNGRYPRFLRSDHGSETVMVARAHHRIHQAHTPDITPEKCYIYGASTENTRIETWWGQLSKGMVYRWRVSCKYLHHSSESLFDTYMRNRTTFMPLKMTVFLARTQSRTRLLFWQYICHSFSFISPRLFERGTSTISANSQGGRT